MKPQEADPTTLDRIAGEFVQRHRRGQTPDIEEYASRHPDCADEIRELFPTIAAMEHARRSADEAHFTTATQLARPSLERLGDFRIIREIGRGGMGVVYEAEQESLGRRVAIKVLPAQFLDEPGRRERFEREARLAARLHHTNIVPVFGVGEHEGHHYYVMQYIRGVGLSGVFSMIAGGGAAPKTTNDILQTVRRCVADSAVDARAHSTPSDATRTSAGAQSTGQSPAHAGRIDVQTEVPPAEIGIGYWRSIARLIAQAADALAFAHGHGVLHRDVKPANLLLDESGTVWVADFGLATHDEIAPVTQSGDFAGTLRYMAPERFDGRYEARSDVYSLGVTLYELALLRPAFDGRAGRSVIKSVLNDPLPAPRRIYPAMPLDLETIILTATAKEPSNRYASAASLRDDLRRFADDLPIQARWISPVERFIRWSRRNRALASSLAAVFVLLVTIASVASISYVRVSRAEADATKALAGQTRQRERAESALHVAEAALDQVFNRLAPESTLDGAADSSDSSQEASLTAPVSPVLTRDSAELLKSMLGFYSRLAEQEGGSRTLSRKTASAQRRVGEIYERLGQLSDARAAYEESILRLGKLVETDPTDRGAAIALAEARNALAELHDRERRPDESRAELDSALRLLAPLATAGPADDAVAFALARTHYLLSRVSVPERELRRLAGPLRPDADPPPSASSQSRPASRPRRSEELAARREHLNEATAILERLCAAPRPAPAHRQLLARCLRGPVGPASAAEDVAQRRERAVQLLEQLVAEFPTIPDYRFDLAETYSTFDRAPGGAARVTRGVAMMDELHRERPDSPEYAASLAAMLFRLSRSQERTDDREAAWASLSRACAIQNELTKKYPQVLAYALNATSFDLAAARVLEQNDQLEWARDYLEKVVTRLDTLKPDAAQETFLRRMKQRALAQLEQIHTALGDQRAAEEIRSRIDRPQPPARQP